MNKIAQDIAVHRATKDVGDSTTNENLEAYMSDLKKLHDLLTECQKRVPALVEWTQRNNRNDVVYKLLLPIVVGLVGLMIGRCTEPTQPKAAEPIPQAREAASKAPAAP